MLSTPDFFELKKCNGPLELGGFLFVVDLRKANDYIIFYTHVLTYTLPAIIGMTSGHYGHSFISQCFTGRVGRKLFELNWKLFEPCGCGARE